MNIAASILLLVSVIAQPTPGIHTAFNCTPMEILDQIYY